jgi:hypothetical protein
MRRKINMAERKLIGVVGVDSGQLMIMDPCYVESQWVNDVDSNATGLKFWGEGQEEAAVAFKEKGIAVDESGGTYFIAEEVMKAPEAIEIIQSVKRETGKMIVYSIWSDSSYHKICDLTNSEQQAGGLNYRMGHPGLGVAFTSGLGDGCYNVYATYKDIPQWGNRITKVEIELIDTDSSGEEEGDE